MLIPKVTISRWTIPHRIEVTDLIVDLDSNTSHLQLLE
jgi:hypothetical protein